MSFPSMPPIRVGFTLERLVKEIRHLDVHCTHEGLAGFAEAAATSSEP